MQVLPGRARTVRKDSYQDPKCYATIRRKALNLLKKLVATMVLMAVVAVPALAEAGTKIDGVITHWDKSGLTLRADGKEWKFAYDKNKTDLDGHPRVDVHATCWYKKSKDGNLWLTKLYVQDMGESVGNELVPQVGQVLGTVTRFDPTKIFVRQGGVEWMFGMDNKKTTIGGDIKIDNVVTVTFWKDKAGTLYALDIEPVIEVEEIDIIEIDD